MQFNLKEYRKQKTKQYLKNNNIILFSINANRNLQDWITIEQELQKLKFNYYKVCNQTTKKMIQQSTNMNIANVINSTFFFLKPTTNKSHIDAKILQKLNSILFTVLSIKLNKNVYSISQSKKIISFNHKKNIAILYQFLQTSSKLTHFVKSSNNQNHIKNFFETM